MRNKYIKYNLKFIPLLIVLLTYFNLSGYCQNDSRRFDREKWKELVDDINKRRYDPKEIDKNYRSEEESYSTEDNNYNSSNSNNSSNDEGVYDANSYNDDDFFSEDNDRMGDGNGTNDGEGNGNELGDENGNGTSNGDGGSTYSSDNPNTDKNGHPQYQPPPQKTVESSSSESSGFSGTWLLIIMGVLLVGALVYMILVSFKDKNKKTTIKIVDENKFENLTITKSELELALEEALRNNNFREAVRIYFIAVIKEMKDKNWIKWEKKKTNYNYINEISGKTQQPDFIVATRAFEIVWYGNRPIAQNEYKQVEPIFVNLLKSING